MPKDRFEHLEGDKPLPGEVKDAIAQINRFHALEIGATRPAPPPKPEVARATCRHCGQPNEPQRDSCWACFKLLRPPETNKPAPKKEAPKGPEDITIVLDGTTYNSSDPGVPDDVRELMKRIRQHGYSEALMAEWRSWRVTRNSAKVREPEPSIAPASEERDIKVFKGQRVSVIRIDGKVYNSDDPTLSPELKQLFEYIEANGVTPALMEYLRGFGDSVKFRPPTTAHPSDGDLAFWDQVNQSRPQGNARERIEQAEADYELERAQRRYDAARSRMYVSAAGVGFFILYIILSAILR